VRRPHLTAGDGFDSFVIVDIDKRHLRAFNRRAWAIPGQPRETAGV
jgi:hypothetical protein